MISAWLNDADICTKLEQSATDQILSFTSNNYLLRTTLYFQTSMLVSLQFHDYKV